MWVIEDPAVIYVGECKNMTFKALDFIQIKLWVTSIGKECHPAEGQGVRN